MFKVFLDVAIILIATKLGSMLSLRVKMPQVLGALIAGVIIGPSLLGVVHENEYLRLLSELGVVMLMFLAGLETDLNEFKKAGKSATLIGIGGIIIPLVFGTLAAFLFYSDFWENVFIGVILTATSVSITVQTLKELGKLNTRAGMNILGAAVVDDILGLLIISFVIVLAQTSKSASEASPVITLLGVGGKVLIFCIASVLSVIFLPKQIERVSNRFGKNSSIIVFAIALALISAFLAEELGIAAITGAYVCGLFISPTSYKEFVEEKVDTIASNFLTPIFFASVGLAANLRETSANILLFTFFMLVIAILGKLIGCGVVARLLGMTKEESIQIGSGMVSRGEVALITTNLGLQNKIITPELFVPTLIVVVVTTLLTPILLKRAFAGKAR